MDSRDSHVGVDVDSLRRENAELRRQLQTALIGSGDPKEDEVMTLIPLFLNIIIGVDSKFTLAFNLISERS